MSRAPLVVLGTSEHARVVLDAAIASGAWEVAGCTGPDMPPAAPPGGPPVGGEADARAAVPPAEGLPGIPFLGPDPDVAARIAGQPAAERPWLVIGFGAGPAERRRAVATYGEAARWATVVHPAAWVSPGAQIGAGAVVMAGAVVNAGAVVGPHAIVNSGAIVEHDVRVGAFTHLAPGTVIGGGTVIGEGSMVGLGATVRDHVVIGDGAVVAMGAVVVADVPAAAVVLGVPARERPGARSVTRPGRRR